MRAKRKLKLILAVLLIVLAGVALKSTYFASLLSAHNQAEMRVTKLGRDKLRANILRAQAHNRQMSDPEWNRRQGKVQNISAQNLYSAQRQYQKDPQKAASLQGDVIGSIALPTIQTYLPILNGATDEHLLIGAGTTKRLATMGGVNNYTLAAHNIEVPHIMFSSLSDLNAGDTVFLTDLQKVYVYKIDKKYIVNPHAIDIQNDLPGQRTLTLYTCYNEGRERTVAQGTLSYAVPYDQAANSVKNLFNLNSHPSLEW